MAESSLVAVSASAPKDLPPPSDALLIEEKKGKRTSQHILKKLEIIDFYDSCPEGSKEKLTFARYPESVKSSGTVGRWKKASLKFGWKALPITLCATMKEIPNYWRFQDKLLEHQLPLDGPEVQKGKRSCLHGIPEEVLCTFDIQESRHSRALRKLWRRF